jgi:hypothetical protein
MRTAMNFSPHPMFGYYYAVSGPDADHQQYSTLLVSYDEDDDFDDLDDDEYEEDEDYEYDEDVDDFEEEEDDDFEYDDEVDEEEDLFNVLEEEDF